MHKFKCDDALALAGRAAATRTQPGDKALDALQRGDPQGAKDRVRRLLSPRHPALWNTLGCHGFPPSFQTRKGLGRRAIQRRLLDPLSLMILEGKFKEGDTVRVGLEKGRDQLEIGPAAPTRS
jgi:hypothetical protein